jgi:hypothetical protein
VGPKEQERALALKWFRVMRLSLPCPNRGTILRLGLNLAELDVHPASQVRGQSPVRLIAAIALAGAAMASSSLLPDAAGIRPIRLRKRQPQSLIGQTKGRAR